MRLCIVQKVHIPGHGFDIEHELPCLGGELLFVPVVAQAFIREFAGAIQGLFATVSRKNGKPDDVGPEPVIFNIGEQRLQVGEPPTAGRSDRGQNRDEPHIAAVACEHGAELGKALKIGE